MNVAGHDTETVERIQKNLLEFLEQRTRQNMEPDADLFASGLVSSMFAMELLVHVEGAFGVSVAGSDLKIDNFRSVDAMTELVLSLGGDVR